MPFLSKFFDKHSDSRDKEYALLPKLPKETILKINFPVSREYARKMGIKDIKDIVEVLRVNYEAYDLGKKKEISFSQKKSVVTIKGPHEVLLNFLSCLTRGSTEVKLLAQILFNSDAPRAKLQQLLVLESCKTKNNAYTVSEVSKPCCVNKL